MRYTFASPLPLCLLSGLLLTHCGETPTAADTSPGKTDSHFYGLEDFGRILRYDTHEHVNTADPLFIDFAVKNNY